MADPPLAETREALHELADRVISALRVQATGNEIALQARPGGFGTPDLPAGGWAGIADGELVAPDGRRAPVTSLRAAAEHIGLADARVLPDEPLEIDREHAAALGALFARGDAALRALRADADADEQPSDIHLWPEHFDIAIELGARAARATYGVSPGDRAHADPYAYVAPWTAPPPGPLWQADGFAGAQAPAADADAIVAFWRERRAALRDQRTGP
jgi:hypothetical protein